MTGPIVAASDLTALRGEARRVIGLACWNVHLPGAHGLATDLARASGVAASRLTAALAGAAHAGQAHRVLGRKGLLYKEPATRLALCTVQRALGLPPGRPARAQVDTGTAVVVACNLGNAETIADLVRTVRAEGGRSVSPLAAPNASSNVVASQIALWFGFAGPNLTICSGATAGLDAVHAATLLLRAGRATRVVVVGTEPGDEVATGLLGAGRAGQPLRAGAACLVLTGDGPANGHAPHVVLLDDDPGRAALRLGPDGTDPGSIWGDCYGAAGVVNAALAAVLLDAGLPGPVAVTCGDETDGRRELVLGHPGEGHR